MAHVWHIQYLIFISYVVVLSRQFIDSLCKNDPFFCRYYFVESNIDKKNIKV